MEKISVHDNLIISYTVSAANREISLMTKYETKAGLIEQTEIIFRGVEGYYFEGDNLGTIIFDIEECLIEEILKEYKSQFAEGVSFGWPGSWNESEERVIQYLKNKNVKAWSLSSSYGMGGFVFARTIEYRTIKQSPTSPHVEG